jgi:hypothetical protein
LPFQWDEKHHWQRLKKYWKQLAKVVDGLTGFWRGTNWRANWKPCWILLLPSHFWHPGKWWKCPGQSWQQSTFGIDSKMLWDKYHFINSFAE